MPGNADAGGPLREADGILFFLPAIGHANQEEQAAELSRINAMLEAMDSPEFDAEMEMEATEIAREVDREVEPLRFQDYRARGQEVGFWADEEDDEFGQVEDDDDDFEEEDITSVAHSELEVHREMREYARIVAWDMPLLKSKRFIS